MCVLVVLVVVEFAGGIAGYVMRNKVFLFLSGFVHACSVYVLLILNYARLICWKNFTFYL